MLLRLLKVTPDLSKLLRIFWLVIVFVPACGTGFLPSEPFETNTPQIPSSEVIPTKISLTPLREPADLLDCALPYTSDSIWNTPIDWDAAHIHPSSETMLDAFFSSDSWIGSDTSQFAPNIYFVDNNTQLKPVRLWDNRSFRDATSDVEVKYGEQGGTVLVPLPVDARPAPGTDGELVIVNLDTGEEWGMLDGQIDDQGSWSVGGVYLYNVKNSGVPPKGFAHRGAGIGSLAGIVRPCEIERGKIGHAVTIAYDYPCAPEICNANGWSEVIPPFSKTDGEGFSQFDIPEGARLAIKPQVSSEEIFRACGNIKGCIVWAQNMQEYGGFIVDNSGHPKTYAEGNMTANWDDSVWSKNMLKDIPMDWYVVLDWN